MDGGPRRRIAGLEASPALQDLSWHDVRIVRNVRTGSIEVSLDKQTTPRFSGSTTLSRADKLDSVPSMRLVTLPIPVAVQLIRSSGLLTEKVFHDG